MWLRVSMQFLCSSPALILVDRLASKPQGSLGSQAQTARLLKVGSGPLAKVVELVEQALCLRAISPPGIIRKTGHMQFRQLSSQARLDPGFYCIVMFVFCMLLPLPLPSLFGISS